MTQPITRDFPNIERLLAGIVAPAVGGLEHVGSQAPGDLEAYLPFVRVYRVGGPRTHLVDYPVVDVDLFAVDEVTGAPLASRIANLLLTKPPPHPAIDMVACEPAFRELPWGDNEEVRRWGATFSFETRQVRALTLP